MQSTPGVSQLRHRKFIWNEYNSVHGTSRVVPQTAVLIGCALTWHRNCSNDKGLQAAALDAAGSHGREANKDKARKLGDDAGTGNDSH
jgi:hypothetical protein